MTSVSLLKLCGKFAPGSNGICSSGPLRLVSAVSSQSQQQLSLIKSNRFHTTANNNNEALTKQKEENQNKSTGELVPFRSASSSGSEGNNNYY